jgi:hypothetical protein
LVTNNNFYREKERILLSSCSKVDYDSTIWPDQIDEKACWFRNHFVGKPYITFIGPIMDDENDLAVISIVKEKRSIMQYRIIVRTKQVSLLSSFLTIHTTYTYLLLLLL